MGVEAVSERMTTLSCWNGAEQGRYCLSKLTEGSELVLSSHHFHTWFTKLWYV
jgi:hypothetical protein